MDHLFNWIEIPVTDMGRAVKFYERILGIELNCMTMGGTEYALFPSKDRFNCGALAKGENHRPGPGGVVVYLDGGRDLDAILRKVGPAGGTVTVPKMFLSDEAGHIGMFMDSEGNHIGLQHAKDAS
jgi:uncharacterized protein